MCQYPLKCESAEVDPEAELLAKSYNLEHPDIHF